ncbi:MAG: HAMP domain-containing histidine kinase [Anaerolineae bacterium]|nr:HAMP domain-containing histidine kinase [Anaerolineae bacterium]
MNIMNRLWVRLTLAFVTVTLVGVSAVVLLVDWSAGGEFRQYIARREMLVQNGVLDSLSDFYASTGNWTGVDQVLAGRMGGRGRGSVAGGMGGRPTLILADADYHIVYDERGTAIGETLTSDERGNTQPIMVEGKTVGYVLVVGNGPGHGSNTLQAPEQAFLDQLRNTLVIAALIAIGAGLALGLLISRALAAPLANLAQAAHSFAAHQWDSRVPVHGTNEIAAVASAFNEMADELQQAETLRRNLMADIAHDLRTPLTVMQGNLRAMLDEVYPLDHNEIATLYDETRLLSRLVDDIRELALADAGQLPIHIQTVDAAAILHTTVENFALTAQDQQIQVHLVVDDNLPPVCADPDRLTQVVRNLLSNALRHAAGRSITVSGNVQPSPQPMVCIAVADSGDGIPPEELPRIFERFYRADKSRTGSGTGLGLAIAKAWVEAMHGSIGVQSTPGQGSRFWFTLPMALR